MKSTNSLKTLLASSILSAVMFSANTIAEDYQGKRVHGQSYGHGAGGYEQVQYDPYSPEFRAHYPLKVFVGVDAGRYGNNEKLRYLVIETLARRLPYGVELVHKPRHADLVIRAKEEDFDADFRVVDIDRRDKKYKKRVRRSTSYGGGCGLRRAHYTRVKEKGVGYYNYGVKIRMKGYGKDYTRVGGKVYEDYRYGKDLKAQTSCGFKPVSVFPSNGVEKLFAQSHPSYRKEVVRELRREAACDLGLRLAYIIKARTDTYYTDLAYQLQEKGKYYSDNSSYGGYGFAQPGSRHNRR